MTPAWSPDGQRIAFTSGRAVGNDIYLVEIATGNLTQLTTNPEIDRGPVWSPDGSRLLFQSNRAGSFDIWSVKADGSGLLRMTEHSGDEMRPVWSPDGSRIAFEANWTGNDNWGIFVMASGGSPPIVWNITKDDIRVREAIVDESAWPAKSLTKPDEPDPKAKTTFSPEMDAGRLDVDKAFKDTIDAYKKKYNLK